VDDADDCAGKGVDRTHLLSWTRCSAWLAKSARIEDSFALCIN
jgi:hypothetical protein